MFVEELTRFGLSEKEARVYLALLELEVATANEAAKASGVNRSSTYVVLESLQKRGLVSVTAGGKVQKYIAAHPEQLARMAEHQAQKCVEAKEDIDRILPELTSLYTETKEKPKVRVFEGKEGLVNAFEITLKSKEKLMRVVSSGTDIQRSLPDYLPRYVQRRMELGIVMHGIHPFDEIAKYLKENVAHKDTIQLIPPEKWTFMSDFAIYDDTVSFMLHKELITINVESKAIADGMKKIFDLAFEEAKRLDVSNQRPTKGAEAP